MQKKNSFVLFIIILEKKNLIYLDSPDWLRGSSFINDSPLKHYLFSHFIVPRLQPVFCYKYKKRISPFMQIQRFSLFTQTLKKVFSLSDWTNPSVYVLSAQLLFAEPKGSSRDKRLSFLTACFVTLSGNDRALRSPLLSLSAALVGFFFSYNLVWARLCTCGSDWRVIRVCTKGDGVGDLLMAYEFIRIS